jgi:hypothetical protein
MFESRGSRARWLWKDGSWQHGDNFSLPDRAKDHTSPSAETTVVALNVESGGGKNNWEAAPKNIGEEPEG